MTTVEEADLFLESMERLEDWAKAKLKNSRGKKRVALQTALAGMYGQLHFLITIAQKELTNAPTI